MDDAYATFLASKRLGHGRHGVDARAIDLHPVLHDWQAVAVRWALDKGRCALFWDCGLGKTYAQVEWARHAAGRALIVAPLSVARQTVREAAALDVDVRYARHGDEVGGPGVWITNYEMVDRFDADRFGAVVLDESSILKNVDGRTRRTITEHFGRVPMRLACTATPAPNDVSELVNHAEFLGVMSRVEMLAAYFVHDDEGWRLKGHAAEPMYRWMGSWAHALRSPADMGHPDDDYRLPPLRVHAEVVDVDIEPPEGQLFAADLGGVAGRAQVRRQTIDARVRRAADLASDGERWIVWCGLNEEAEMAERMIDGAVNVPGAWAPDRKAEALEAFQDGAVRVLVTKPQIAGFGMNFQTCSRMAFVGIGDSYERYYQAVRRCYRFGQDQPVDAHVIVSELEAQIAQNVERKEREAARSVAQMVRAARPDQLEAMA